MEDNWQAGYSGLTPDQDRYYGELMTMPGKQWPQALKDRVRAVRPRNGDHLADTVGRWVKEQASEGWQVRPVGDSGRHTRVHYIEQGSSLCALVGSNILALVPQPEAGSNACKSCHRALATRPAREGQ